MILLLIRTQFNVEQLGRKTYLYTQGLRDLDLLIEDLDSRFRYKMHIFLYELDQDLDLPSSLECICAWEPNST